MGNLLIETYGAQLRGRMPDIMKLYTKLLLKPQGIIPRCPLPQTDTQLAITAFIRSEERLLFGEPGLRGAITISMRTEG